MKILQHSLLVSLEG